MDDQTGSNATLGSAVHPQFFEATITFLISAAMAAYTLTRAERSRVHWLVAALVAGMMMWSGCVALSRSLPGSEASQVIAQVTFLGIFAVPPLWFLLAIHLANPANLDANRLIKIAALAPSGFFVLVLISNPLHHAFIMDTTRLELAPPDSWAGDLYWVWTAWGYTLIVAATAVHLASSLRLMDGPDRARGMLLAVAATFPLVASVLHNLSNDPTNYDRTPLFMSASVCVLFFVDWRYRLLDTMPLARRDVIDQLADGVIVADARGMILDMNAAAEAMVQATAAELRGKNLVSAIAAQSRGRVEFDESRFEEIVDRLRTSEGDFQIQVEDFEGRVYEIRGGTVRSKNGHVSGLYLIIRDRTEQERYDGLLRQARRLESVQGLAGGIAHEVNNPLAYVRSNMSHVLRVVRDLTHQPVKQRDRDLKRELDDLCGVVEESLEGIGRIASIIDGVQRFSRLDSDQSEQLSVGRVVQDAIGSAELRRWPEIRLVDDIDDEDVFVPGSSEALSQAIVNLLLNAARAVRDQGGGEVRVRTRATEDVVEISVIDDGPGISDEISEQIYDPFFTTRSPGDGTGLGLAVTFRIVREHGGVLLHEPSDTGGACFTINLPRV